MQDIEIADLRRISELIHEKYQYDFRNYAISSFKRRVLRIMEINKITIDILLNKLTDSPVFIDEFITDLTVNVTEMFRDPDFWRALRKEVIPAILLNHKTFKIWHAGCSSGEEVITMCILLKEMNILQHVQIVATDLDADMLERARSACYPIKTMEVNEKNYIRFQGETPTLGKYYELKNNQAVFNPELLVNVTFEKHDLVLGQSFNKFDLILCRNVMIYFNQTLQNEVLKKFKESLFKYAYLAIGSKESLVWCDYANHFIVANNEEKIYKKIKD